MKLPITAVALTLSAIGASPSAAADGFEGARSGALVERVHEIEVTVDRGFATLRVRRTVVNGGERHDQATFMIEAPERSVAVGLRTLGARRGKPTWFRGELLEAEAAAEKYRELTGIGGYSPKDPALLSWRGSGRLALQVFPCPPDERQTVEYTLLLPTHYENGRDRLELDRIGTDALAADLVIRAAHRADRIYVDGHSAAQRVKARADRPHRIAIERRDGPPIRSDLGVVSTGEGYLVRYELAIAPRLSTIPRDAGVVVVLDTSASIDPDDLAAQVAAAQAYLGHFAARGLRARAEVIAFDRKAHPMHGRLRPVSKVLSTLDGFTFPQRNGSHLDVALRRATELLDAANVEHRRIVVLSDTLMRSELTTLRVAEAAHSTSALVHVGLVANVEPPSLLRDDGHSWSEAARATGGLVWEADASAAPTRAEEMRNVYLEWARPVRVDDPLVLAPAMFETDFDLPESLAEGFGQSTMVLQGEHVRHVVLSGTLWSKPLLDVATPDEVFGTRWAALVFGTDLVDTLTDPEMMALAMRGGAVSPVTSYLAVEPGVRPSVEGLDWELPVGRTGSGLASGGLTGTGTPGVLRERTSAAEAFLAEQIGLAAHACGVPEHISTDVELQTTLREIVEVNRVDFVGYDNRTQSKCVSEQIWGVELPAEFTNERKRWTVRS